MNSHWGIIKDPLYGYLKVSDLEKQIIDTYPVQRLRRIKQLSGAEYVYPAANHTRFEHSLGTMHLTDIYTKNLPIKMKPFDIQSLKIAALLHDLGHGPFSHVFESFLIKYLKKTHEDMTSWLIKKSEVNDFLVENGLDTALIGDLAIGNLKDPNQPFLDQIISSTVDVDKMDFIARDSYHTGAGYGQADIFRLIYTMELHNGFLTVSSTALATLETFLLARFESFKTIYFHKASRAVQLMLVKALELAQDEMHFLNFKDPDEYLFFDDFTTWTKLRECEESKSIIEEINNRNLLKCAYETTLFTKDKVVTSIFTSDNLRDRLEKDIASEARIERDYVIIDVPSLPSVPYSSSSHEPMEIPISHSLSTGEKVIKKVTELSEVIEVLKAYMNIVRVYTSKKYRKRVEKASENIFGSLPSETTISY